MKYTVRYAHLSKTDLVVGQAIKEGDVIGIMGNTGQSTGAHLHIDCVRGRQEKRYTIAEMESGKIVPEPKQLNYFIDDKLFASDFRITTYYCEPEYMRLFRKLHFGYDIVPKTGSGLIFWNRSKIGNVTQILTNDSAYGNCVSICFEA